MIMSGNYIAPRNAASMFILVKVSKGRNPTAV